MRYWAAALLLVLASCSARTGASPVPLDPPATVLASWKPNLHLADTALAGGAPTIALQVCDELLAMDPRNTGALVRRGEALSDLGRSSEAKASFTMAIDADPENLRALDGLGRLRLADDPAAAEALFARAMTRDPNDVIALSDLGVARDMQGHHAAAQQAYRMALNAAPASVAVQVNLGLSLALSGDATGAIKLLQPLAAASNAAPRVRQNLALALALSGRKNEALNVLGRDLTPDQAQGALDGFEALRP